MAEQWYPAYEWVIDPKSKKLVEVISENVVGRFITHPVIDGPASAEAQRNVYKDGVMLLAKAHMDVLGRQSHDVSSHPINPDKDPEGFAAAVKRFPEAWKVYQAGLQGKETGAPTVPRAPRKSRKKEPV